MWEQMLEKYLESMPPDTRAKTREYNLRGIERGEELAEKLLFNPEGMRVLDVGCGSGGITIAYSKLGAYVHAIEPDRTLCDIAQRRAYESDTKPLFMNFTLEEASRILKINKFNLIIMNDTLEHLPDPSTAIKQCKAMLEPPGLLYISTPNKLSFKQILHEEHSGLAFVSLMPPKIAAKYVKWRKNINSYTVNRIHSYREIVGYFNEHNMEYLLLNKKKPLKHMPFIPIQAIRNIICTTLRPGNFEFVAWNK